MKDATQITRCVQHDMVMNEMSDKLSNLTMLTNKIHDAILGDYDKKGLKTLVYELEERTARLEKLKDSLNAKMWSIVGFVGVQFVLVVGAVIAKTFHLTVR